MWQRMSDKTSLNTIPDKNFYLLNKRIIMKLHPREENYSTRKIYLYIETCVFGTCRTLK